MITVEDLGVGSILDPISFSIAQNTLIIGPSGAGKTTLLKAMLGLTETNQTVGRIVVDDVDVTKVIGPKRNISMIWQDCRLIPSLTVRENLELVKCDYTEALELLRIPHLIDRYPHEISGGEAQRVNIARGISAPAKYVFMDEPMQGIDPVVVRKILKNMMHYLKKRKKVAVMVTHEIYHVYGLFQKVLAMKNGQIVAEGDFEALYNEPTSPWLANFFGPYTVLSTADLKCFDLHSNENPCMVRPEWFKLKKPPFKRPHALNAVVTSVVWEGPVYKVNVSLLGTSKPLAVEVNTDVVFKPGENVYVNFKKCSRPSWVRGRF